MIRLALALFGAWLDTAREQRARIRAEGRLQEALAALGEARLDLLRQKRARERAEDEARMLRERARGCGS